MLIVNDEVGDSDGDDGVVGGGDAGIRGDVDAVDDGEDNVCNNADDHVEVDGDGVDAVADDDFDTPHKPDKPSSTIGLVGR
jgi:hypothetical protein